MSIASPVSPDLLALEEARPAHLRWSAVNGEFLDFVAENPEYLERDTFHALHEARWMRKYRLQCWPLFIGARQAREVEAMTLGLDRLMKGVVERFLGSDPARILEFYRAPYLNARNLAVMLAEPVGISGAPARADYLEDAEGLKFLEYNAGGAVGGMQMGLVGEMHLAASPLARFLAATGRGARAGDTLGAFFRHHVDETARLGVWTGGDFNVAVVNRPNHAEDLDLERAEMYDAALQRVLAERGMTGAAVACGPDDFAEVNGSLVAAGRPMHVVLQLHGPGAHLRLPFILSKMGAVNFISGPIGNLLSDKRNLALLSANARSDEFTGAERDLIERHVPWTRVVGPARTTFRGRAIRLPDDLPEHRREMVLKRATLRGGHDVLVGRFRSDAEWREDVARAAREGDWIVQAYVEPVACCFQQGERGAVRQDLVWGLFAFGSHFGGAVMRMQAHATGGGVVNSTLGAEMGVLLFADE
jgi:hypothetical protein